jgi:tetratricopeptide (TPR) repeat protein
VRMLSPEQLLARLGQRLDLLKGGRGLDDRQQTLRATIDWSHELLDADEQRLFARLSVFRGGWTLDAAEQVCDADLDVLQSLLDKSLIRLREERFGMLETIRQYAAEKLEASGEADDMRRRHTEFFLALAEEAAPRLALGDAEWLHRLETDHDNVRAAFDRSLAVGNGRTAQRLTGLLFDFWMVRGHFIEAALRAEAAVVADPTPTAELARALSASSNFHETRADHGLARTRAEQAIEVATAIDDRRGLAHGRHALGSVVSEEQDWPTARDLWQQSLADFTALGDDHWMLASRRALAYAAEQLGDVGHYHELVRENLAHARRAGDRRIEARSVSSLGLWALEEGRLAEAIEHFADSLRIDRQLANPMFIAVNLVRFAIVLARRTEAAAAALLLGRSDRIWQDIGATPEPWMAEEREQARTLVRDRLDEQVFEEHLSAGHELALDDACDIALARAFAQPADPPG